MAWVDQHKIHNSPNKRSLIARKTELAIAMVETKIVILFGNDFANTSQ
jgi:hypothetical protein